MGDDQDEPLFEVDSHEELACLWALDATLPEEMSARASARLKLMCLRGRKYDTERAAQLVPQLLALCDEYQLANPPKQLEEDLLSQKMTLPGGSDEFGRRVVWVRLRYHSPKKREPETMARLVATVMTYAMRRSTNPNPIPPHPNPTVLLRPVAAQHRAYYFLLST